MDMSSKTLELTKKASELKAQGLSGPQIAPILGVTAAYVGTLLRYANRNKYIQDHDVYKFLGIENTRIISCLQCEGIETVEQVAKMTLAHFKRVAGIGEKSAIIAYQAFKPIRPQQNLDEDGRGMKLIRKIENCTFVEANFYDDYAMYLVTRSPRHNNALSVMRFFEEDEQVCLEYVGRTEALKAGGLAGVLNEAETKELEAYLEEEAKALAELEEEARQRRERLEREDLKRLKVKYES
jgi:hypothetical protein